METSYLTTFDKLFTFKDGNIEISKIVIPKIQRDYAQGRENIEVERVRKNFLDALYKAIDGQSILLDFIYGDVNKTNKELIPLDGQQRLTTLYLLYWFAAKKDKIPAKDYSFLKNFTYETRHSSREFCQKLIDFNPDLTSNESLQSQISDQFWFPYDWKNDATIKSMLVMLDAIKSKFCKIEGLRNKLIEGQKIKFYFLPIEQMGLTDKIYIKMNSRGRPLTSFEHFKSEFQRQIKNIDRKQAQNIEMKIDTTWTDFLWKQKGENEELIDNLFLNYFSFICDIFCYRDGKSIKDREYDYFNLIDEYFGESQPKRKENLVFLEQAFDVWLQFEDTKKDLFDYFFSCNIETNKVRLLNCNETDLLSNCLQKYIKEVDGKRERAFSHLTFVMLYAVLLYVLNRNNIADKDARERLRIINNLIMNSSNELTEREKNEANRIPVILKQTESIIVNGVIPNDNEAGFNNNQLKEEKEKQSWKKDNSVFIEALNRLEDHDLLRGQIGIVGLEDPTRFEKFEKLYKCDKEKISRALLTYGDYSQVSAGSRYHFGTDSNVSWEYLFHKSGASIGYENTHKILCKLLDSSENFTNEDLDKLCNQYLEGCELKKQFNLRYYFIKYKAFWPKNYGIYKIDGEIDGKIDEKYSLLALVTRKKVSTNSFQPFLKEIDESKLDRENNGNRLFLNNKYVYCKDEGFEIEDSNNNQIDKIIVEQDENGVDKEDRISKYKEKILNKLSEVSHETKKVQTSLGERD